MKNKNIFKLLLLIIFIFLNNSLTPQEHDRLGGWYPLISGTNVNFSSMGFCDENTGYVVGSGDVRRTTNGGINWDNVSEADPYYIRSVSFRQLIRFIYMDMVVQTVRM